MKKLVFASFLAAGLLATQSCKKENNGSELTAASEVTTTDPAIDEAAMTNTASAVGQTQAEEVASNQPLTSVVLAQSHFDFGNVKKGESVQHDYEITNTGTNPLIISKVVPGCGCTAPDYTKEPILPGKKGKITLKFDSSSFDGAQHKQAEVYANVEKGPMVITFSANVQPK